jgi:hypothetical protein
MLLKGNEYIIILFQDYLENVKSYRNIKLCTQNLFSKFRKIVIKNDNEWNEYIIILFQDYLENVNSYRNI